MRGENAGPTLAGKAAWKAAVEGGTEGDTLWPLTCTVGVPESQACEELKTSPDLNKAFSPFHLVATFKEKYILFQPLNRPRIGTHRPKSNLFIIIPGLRKSKLALFGQG